MSWLEKLKRVPRTARGIVGAMALLGTAPQFVPYSAMEIVSLVHAIIVGWNQIMSGFWAVIASAFHLPKIPPEIVSAAVLGFSLSSTWAYSIFASEKGKHHGFVQNAAFWARILMALLDGPILLMMAFLTYPGPLSWIALLGLAVTLLTSLIRLPKYRAGFLIALGFIGFLEIVYLFSTDAVRDKFDIFVCAQQGVELPQCKTVTTS